MTAIARSPTPLTVVRGLPFSFPMTLRNPDGTPVNLTGFTISAQVLSPQPARPLTVARTNNAAGQWSVAGSAEISANLHASSETRMVITLTDPQGAPRVFVYPLASHTP